MEKMSIEEIKTYLSKHNVKPSLSRVKIYEYLIVHKSHPTVEEIYNALSKELITLSKTTVYNTLKLFLENNLVIQILIEDIEARYDADISRHGHFKCNVCNEIYDFRYTPSNLNIPTLEGFICNEYHTYIKGVCKSCSK